MAIVEAPDGSILVSGGTSRSYIYRFEATGGEAGAPWAEVDYPIFNMAFDSTGQLWATTGGGPLLQLDPVTGEILNRFGDGLTIALAIEPGTDRIFVSSGKGLEIFDPATQMFSHYSRDQYLRVGSLAYDTLGDLWATTWPDRKQVVRFNDRRRAEAMLTFDEAVDSIAFGQAGTDLEGLLLVSHNVGPVAGAGQAAGGSELTMVELATMRQVSVAKGGTRGDVVVTTSDGRILLSQSDQVDVLSLLTAPTVIATNPPHNAVVVLPLPHLSVVFDHDMFVGGSDQSASVLNLSNYYLVGAGLGGIPIRSATYQVDTCTVLLATPALQPGHYELQISNIASTDGLTLPATYVAAFDAVSDFSALVDIAFSHTRADRGEQSVSYDVVVTNVSDRDLLLPLVLMLDPADGYSGVPRSAAGQTPGGQWLIDLSQSLDTGDVLAPGASTLGHTLTIDNPGNYSVQFTAGFSAQQGTNQAPVFDTQPLENATAGQEYGYAVQAHDPDGVAVVYLLYRGPAGMTVDALSGAVSWLPTSLSPALNDVLLAAFDTRGAIGLQSFVITVDGGNRAPILGSLPETLEGIEGQPIGFALGAVDPDGDPLAVTAQNLPAGATFDPLTQIFHWTPDFTAAGTYENVTFTITDGINAVSTQIDMLIAQGGRAPCLATPVARTLREGETLRFYLHGSDEDGDVVTYFGDTLPEGALIDPHSGLFQWTPAYHQAGDYHVPVSITDGLTQTTVIATFHVLNANGQPRFQSLDNWVVYEDEPIAFQAMAVDPDHPAYAPPHRAADGSLLWLDGVPAGLVYEVSGLPSGATFDTDTTLFEWLPGYADAGEYAIVFTVTDDGDGTGIPLATSVTTHITVLNTNRPPEIPELANVTVHAGVAQLLPVAVSDPDGDALTLSATSALPGYPLPDFITFTDLRNGQGRFRFAPQPEDRGDYTIVLAAVDDGGSGGWTQQRSDSYTFVVSVEIENVPPHFDYVGDVVALVGEPLALNVRARDLDGEELTFGLVGLPAGAALTPGTVYGTVILEWTPAAADAGSYTVTVNVTDTANGNQSWEASDSVQFNLIVRGTNVAPVLDVADQTIAEGQTLTLALAATDDDGDHLWYSAANLPFGAVLDSQQGILQWAPNMDQAGNYPNITLAATDGHSTSTASITIHVTNTNQSPQFVATTSQYVLEKQQLKFVIAAQDADHDALAYRTQDVLPSGARLDALSGRFTWTPTYDQAGDYPLTFVVEDGSGLRDTMDVTLHVRNVNRWPVIDVDNHSVTLGATLEFFVQATDLDAGSTLTYGATNLPDGATIDPHTGRFLWTPGPGQAGEYGVAIHVSDGEATASTSIVLAAAIAPRGPQVWLELTPSFPAIPGHRVLVHASADSLAEIAQLTLSVDGAPVTLDAQGRATIVAPEPGKLSIEATATDADGLAGVATAWLKVRDPLDKTAPEVSFAAAESMLLATQVTPIVATIADQNLDWWKLEIAPLGATELRTLAAGEAPVKNSALMLLDPNAFTNGFYRLVLTARDIRGRQSQAEVALEVNTPAKATAYRRAETDLVWTFGGATFALTRTYDFLRRDTMGGAGYGWSLDFREVGLQTNVLPTGQEVLGVYPAFGDDARLYLTLPNGVRVGFHFAPQTLQIAGVTYYRPAWVPDPGIDWQLASVDALLVKAGTQYFDEATGQPYHPASPFFAGSDYVLTSPAGTQYLIDSEHGITEQRESGGQRLFYADSGISTLGDQAIRFVQDAEGRLASVIDPEGGTLIYQYDALGNLVSVRHLSTGQSAQYGYDLLEPHRLTLAVRSGGDGDAILYGNVPTAVPLQSHLGGVGLLAGRETTSQLTAAAVDRYSLGLQPSELASVATGQVLVRAILATQAGGPSMEVPQIAGLPTVSSFTSDHRVEALWAITRSGLQQLLVQGIDAAANGSYTLQITVAGDINADGLVDGLDSLLLDAAFGSVMGEAAYDPAADLDGNGVIAAADRQILIANYGFTANRAPFVAAPIDDVLTHEALRVVIDVHNLATDPDGDRLFYRITGAMHGAARLSADGQYVLFTPEAGYTGSAAVTLVADDGASVSAVATVPVTISSAPLVSLDIQNRLPRLDVGGLGGVVVVGDFADQQDVELDPYYVAFVSSLPTVFTVTDSGQLLGQMVGTGVLTVSRGALRAATAVSVGQPSDALGLYVYTIGIDVYPQSLALPLAGGQRQLLVGIKPGDTSLSSTASGTAYVVSDPSVIAVTADGLVTSVGLGETTVTVLHGAAEVVVPVRVAAPHTGPTVVGTDGGVVRGADGALVAISPGALDQDATVAIERIGEGDLPLPVPDFLTFAAAFELDLSDFTLAEPMQLAVPVPGTIPTGATVHFWQYDVLVAPDGSLQPLWLLVDQGIVGADGLARTASPPYPGFTAGGQYVCALYDSPDSRVDLALSTAGYRIALGGLSSFAFVASLGIGVALDGLLALPFTAQIALDIWTYLGDHRDTVPFASQEMVVALTEGTREQSVIVTSDEPLRVAPRITGIQLLGSGDSPTIVINGSRFGDGDAIEFDLGNSTSWVARSACLSWSDTSVTVQVPQDVILGLTEVYVAHARLGRSNSARITAPGDLAFITLAQGVGVIEKSVSSNTLLKTIAVDGSAMDVVTTSDNSRAYVAVLNLSAAVPSSAVAVIDTLTLDVAATIPLPDDFQCWRLVVDPANDFAYAAGNGDTLLVIDIRADSEEFHEVVARLQLPHTRWTNDGMAVSPDGRRLYVSTYTTLRLAGSVVVIDIDPDDAVARPDLYRAVIADIPLSVGGSTFHPQEIITTTAPDKFLVTPRVHPTLSQPFVFTFTVTDPEPANLRTNIGIIRTAIDDGGSSGGALNEDVIRTAVENPRDVAVLPDLSYAFVTDFATPLAYARVPRGAKVGVIRDPFGLQGGPEYRASTTPIERGYAQQLALSPEGTRLFVGYNGIGEMLVMNVAEMLRASKEMSLEQRLRKPIDESSLGFQIHVTPIVTLSNVSGIAVQGTREVPPKPVVSGIQDRLFTNDSGEFTIRVENSVGTDMRRNLMIIQLDVEGIEDDFLINDQGRPLAATERWVVLPGESQAFHVQLSQFLSEKRIKRINTDRLYGACFRLQVWEWGAEEEETLHDSTFYVYRYVDAADDNHDDGRVEMADTTNDGAAGVIRFRALEQRMPVAIRPTFSPASSDNFFFSDVLGFAFDPTETGQDLTTTLSVGAPNGMPAGTLEMLGDGELVNIVIDEVAFRTVLDNLAAGTPGGDQGADAHELLMIDDVAERNQLVADVITRLELLLAPFRVPGLNGTFGDSDDGGWQRGNASVGGKVVEYNDFLTDVCPAVPGEICPGSTTLGSAHHVDNRENGGVWTLSLPAERAKYSVAEENFRLSETLNERQNGHIDLYVDRYFRYFNDAYRAANVYPWTPYDLTWDELVKALGKTFVHELGHTTGLNHPAMRGIDIGLPGAVDDLMAQGLDTTGSLSWIVTIAAAKVAFGLAYDSAETQQALDYYWAYRQTREAHSDFGDATNAGDDPDVTPLVPVGDGALAILRAEDLSFIRDASFGTVTVDGAGAQTAECSLVLLNSGDQDLIISEVMLAGGDNNFRLVPPAAGGTLLRPFEQLPLNVIYDPTTSGAHRATLEVYNDGLGGTYELDLSGFGLSPSGDLTVEMADNRFGGLATNALPQWKERLVTLRNQGTLPVTIHSIVVGEGNSEFSLGNVPLGLSFEEPLILVPAESFSFDVFFDSQQVGLRRGEIHILTDNPDDVLTTVTVGGTGLATGRTAADVGNDYVAVRYNSGTASVVKRYVSDAQGRFPLSVPAGSSFEVLVFDPVSGLIARNYGIGGEANHVPKLLFMASVDSDSDGDGLPDDIESAIGSAGDNTDTNGDGIDDFESLAQGINPAKPNYASLLFTSGSASSRSGVSTFHGDDDDTPAASPAGGALVFAPASAPIYQPPAPGRDAGDAGSLLTGLVNGSFAVSDPRDPGYGWKTRGNTDVVEDAGNLGEDATYFSGFSQSFIMPEGVTFLRFDIVDLELYANPGDPPDVFEVALLEHSTKEPLVSTALELSQTDALLNVQPTARVFFGAGTNVPGVAGSGDVGSSTLPWTIQVDLQGVAAGTEATLFFDLLGFGALGSRVVLDNIVLASEPLPALEFHLDPAFDSGLVGDDLTNCAAVHLVGTTDPLLTVDLDTDGDGFDDGSTTADELGNFSFVDITLVPGTQLIRMLAGNEFGTTVVDRAIVLDTLPPVSNLVAPAADSVIVDDPGYVDIHWADEGVAGLDPVSLDPDDLTGTGVTIMSVEALPGDIYRYHYAGRLPTGTVFVTVAAGQVVDHASNGNLEQQASFEYNPHIENLPPHIDLNGTADGIDFAIVFVPGGDAQPIVDPAQLRVTDIDNLVLQSATAHLANVLDSGQEYLSVVTTGTVITALYDAPTGLLSLSGTDTLEHYQQVLRTLTYRHLASPPEEYPDPATRTIHVTVNDGNTDSAVATALVEFAPSNVTPALDLNGGEPGTGFTTTLPWGATTISIVSAAATCADSDSTTLAWLTAVIVDPREGYGEILVADTSGTGIESDYDTSSGTLMLSGVDSVENYQRVLRSLQYQNNATAREAVSREIHIFASDGLDRSELVTAMVNIVGGSVTIWGYVYADVNNNGVKDPPELGLPNVPITLSGTVTSVQLTREDGSFSFGYLPAGMYELAEAQPAAFIDGLDTGVDLYEGQVSNDYVSGMEMEPGATARCDFGELGLHSHLISKRLLLASSPSSLVMIHDMMIDGDEWIGFRADQSGTLQATLAAATGESVLELYTAEFTPVVVGPGSNSLSAPINAHEIYVLHAACVGPLALDIAVTDSSTPVTPPVVDVNSDAYVTPIDALLVINRLNSAGTGPVGAQVHLDVNRDGIVSPLDALLVINELNRQDGAEGECTSDERVVSADLSGAWTCLTMPIPHLESVVDWRTTAADTVRRRDAEEFEWTACLDQVGQVIADTANVDDALRLARTWTRSKLRHSPLMVEELEHILADIAADIDEWWDRNS
ncbi:MAG: putative Ig domain-containing protein [Pirellulaceae bacterium]